MDLKYKHKLSWIKFIALLLILEFTIATTRASNKNINAIWHYVMYELSFP